MSRRRHLCHCTVTLPVFWSCVCKVELSNPDDKMGAEVQEEVGKIIKQVNKGIKSPIGNMLFQQYLLDEDRSDREKRLDRLSDTITDKYREHR